MRKNSLKSQAYQTIKNKILSCEFPPGMLLTENMLCDMFSLGRTPVRDAISRLEQEHFVRIFPPKGILVESITITELNSLFETRLLFEPYIVLEYGKNVGKIEFGVFTSYFKNPAILDNPSKFCGIISSFHNIFYEDSANPYLLQFYEQFCAQEQRMVTLFGITSEQLSPLPPLYHELTRFCANRLWNEASGCVREIIIIYRDIMFDAALNHFSLLKRPHKANDKRTGSPASTEVTNGKK